MLGSTQGQNATARIQIDASGGIIGAKIMDGGSAYTVGDSLQVVGVGTTSGYSVGILEVTKIHDNTDDTIDLRNVKPEVNNPYNTLYRITGVTAGSSKESSCFVCLYCWSDWNWCNKSFNCHYPKSW